MNFNFDLSIQVLERTPTILKVLLSGLDDKWIYSNEGEDTWSPFDVVGHLLHGEKTDWIPRLEIILSDKEVRAFKPYDRFAQFEESKGKSMDDLLLEFIELRRVNLKYLKSLNISDELLTRTAIHPSLGTVTLKNLLACWTVHDLSHLAQISRVMSKQYSNEVGPWEEYFRILKT